MINRATLIDQMITYRAKKELRKKGYYYGVSTGYNSDKYNCGSQSSGYSVLPSKREYQAAKDRAYKQYINAVKANYESIYGRQDRDRDR